MTICPDNSTVCLLRVIADANNSFNWNPLNFAFTAATGILALLIACIAVFQGLLAAGPGRLKASKSAIGPWSEKSKSRFDWVELGLRTTAQVPFIKFDSVGYLPQGKPDGSTQGPADNVSTDAAASWLALLQRTAFANTRHWKTRPVATDYLPADIQAAPASAEVLCLVFLAQISDVDITVDYTPGGRFARVQGATSQLIVREHPILGSVAIYEIYGERTSPVMSPEVARASLAFTRGEMSCGGVNLRTIDWVSQVGDPNQICDRISNTMLRECPLNQPVRNICTWNTGTHITRITLTMFLMLVCDLPAGLRSFPRGCVWPDVLSVLDRIWQEIPVWSSPSHTDINAAINTVNADVGLHAAIFDSHSSSHVQMADYSARTQTSWLCLANSDSRRFRKHWFSAEIIERLWLWLRDLQGDRTKSFRSVCNNPSRTFIELQHQLRLLDRFLNCFCLDKAVTTAIDFLREVDGNGIGPSSIRSIQSSLAVLVTLRIVLYAAILDLCGDTAFFYDGSFKNSIVKIL